MAVLNPMRNESATINGIRNNTESYLVKKIKPARMKIKIENLLEIAAASRWLYKAPTIAVSNSINKGVSIPPDDQSNINGDRKTSDNNDNIVMRSERNVLYNMNSVIPNHNSPRILIVRSGSFKTQ